MFHGEQEHNLDDKGRILLPKEYRAELGDVVVLMRGVDGQINVYPKPFFDQMRQRVAEFGDNESFRLTRRAMNAASNCDVDRQGRILIPSLVRRHAQLGEEVVIVGNDDHVEIWNPERYEQTYERLESQFREHREDFQKIREVGLSL